MRKFAVLAFAIACSTSAPGASGAATDGGALSGNDAGLSDAGAADTGPDAIEAPDVPAIEDLGADIKPSCPSGKMWLGGQNPNMRPGEDCIACHKLQGAPTFAVAGTVYPSKHAVDDCNGAKGITVEITGADGVVTKLTTNAVGSFYLTKGQSKVKAPYTALVRSGDNVREMLAEQTNGSCNSCHTQDGDKDAPGRIQAP